MTMDQLMLHYRVIVGAEFDKSYELARLVWAVANGWEKPKDTDIEELKRKGTMVDTV